MMATISSAAWTATYAAQRPSRRMAFSAPMCMGMSAASASTIILRTGVQTSVSLFVVVLCLCSLLLVGLVVLISLLLIGLTGLIRLEGLVGLTDELATSTRLGE